MDFRVRVVRAETVDDGWKSDEDDEFPFNGQESNDEENSPSVVDGLVPDVAGEF